MNTVEYRKKLPIAAEYDVVICGGGSAGYCAAVQAARLGVSVALVEKYGILGGVITTGGNSEIGLFYADGKQIISGVGWETVLELEKEGFAKIPDFTSGADHSVMNVSVNPVAFGKKADDICKQAGVDLLFCQQISDVILAQDNKTATGIVVATKDGLKVINAKQFIDCTGDGDLAAFSGAEYELGDPVTGDLQPGTLRFYLYGYDIKNIDQKQVEEEFQKALKSGELIRSDFWSVGGSPYEIFRTHGNNINHITLNAVNPKSKADGEISGRNSALRVLNWAKRCVKGAENAELVYCASEVAVRETRRIICDKYITVNDYINAVMYDDSICYSYYPIDLHKSSAESLDNIYLKKGTVPSIPLGAMTVKGKNNILVAGRCASGDRLANSAYRVKASCMAMGQAGGAAAALAVKEKCNVRNLQIEKIKNVLRVNNAIVPEI